MNWHALLSGTQPGVGPATLRGLLACAVPAYAAGVRLRTLAYDRGWRAAHRAAVPVISVGNLTTGGTGKTPLVSWVVERLQRGGLTPGILSRGYRALDGRVNDEKLLLDLMCPGTPHLQAPNRAASAATAVAAHRCDVLVLDDGFQHRRLARDLDIVLVDALNPWGYGALLPRGMLREPRSALRRADIVCVTRADQVTPEALAALQSEIRCWTGAEQATVAFEPLGLLNSGGQRAPLDRLQTAAIGACCAVGHPESFLRTLTSLGAPPTTERFRTYPDHHAYSAADREELAGWVADTGIERLIVTQKDLVKLPYERIGRAELWGLEIGVRVLSGGEALCARLRAIAVPRVD